MTTTRQIYLDGNSLGPLKPPATVGVWDLSHSTGAMDLHLDDANVDLAVGCTSRCRAGPP